MASRCPLAKPLKPFELKDWELKFFSHATIEPNFGSSVHGVLWDLSPICEETLDIFEGYPTYYTKRLWDQDDEEFFFYEMELYRQGSPRQSYIDNIREGYDQWGLPVEALSKSLRNAIHTDIYN